MDWKMKVTPQIVNCNSVPLPKPCKKVSCWLKVVKGQKLWEKCETNEYNTENINLQVSWFTLRGWMSNTYHSYKMYITLKKCANKALIIKDAFNMLSDAGIWKNIQLEIYTHPRVACLHTQCGH